MTTSHADHAKALRLIQETGRTFDEANEILFRFNANNVHLISIEPPVEPYTGDKATNPAEHVANLKAIVRSVTKPTEYEEKP